MIQKHAASHLHYDLRLESSQGVLHSWSVPKGMPYADGERRLAIATEDHPIEYLTFEGVIPQGQYGGGTVMVWDIGTCEVMEGNYWKGRMRFHLSGRKLKGEWVLERDAARGHNAWALVKAGGSHKRPAATREDVSAVSGRTMDEIARARDATWQSHRGDAPKAAMRFVEPCIASWPRRFPKAASGNTRSSTTAIARSARAPPTACACGRGAATICARTSATSPPRSRRCRWIR